VGRKSDGRWNQKRVAARRVPAERAIDAKCDTGSDSELARAVKGSVDTMQVVGEVRTVESRCCSDLERGLRGRGESGATV
jgi:hypothetical protein